MAPEVPSWCAMEAFKSDLNLPVFCQLVSVSHDSLQVDSSDSTKASTTKLTSVFTAPLELVKDRIDTVRVLCCHPHATNAVLLVT